MMPPDRNHFPTNAAQKRKSKNFPLPVVSIKPQTLREPVRRTQLREVGAPGSSARDGCNSGCRGSRREEKRMAEECWDLVDLEAGKCARVPGRFVARLHGAHQRTTHTESVVRFGARVNQRSEKECITPDSDVNGGLDRRISPTASGSSSLRRQSQRIHTWDV